MTEHLGKAKPELLPEFLEGLDEISHRTVVRIFNTLVDEVEYRGIALRTVEGFTVSEQLSNIALNTFNNMKKDLGYWQDLDPEANRGDSNG